MLDGYVDASYAQSPADKKSVTGWIRRINGTTFSWQTRKQGCVALSTTGADYIAMSRIAKGNVWIRGLLSELGYAQEGPTIVYEDNQSAMRISGGHNLRSIEACGHRVPLRP
eukprot:Plantae.Rhodophyta-Rhodochaete_pulchella.ctg74517.p1 GENE.Plantae.Rhodophyta-Rhodochaete_pulchella.ctg74517~~Plantae.Rhodophyta-Rhodochaete_pulchella.ctg74517.p1  ORF type:complete len:112 (+),score=1.82 Plantae.Rhodophyta-Rhodochaete_pulchella.ctg74517:88-423(+)